MQSGIFLCPPERPVKQLIINRNQTGILLHTDLDFARIANAGKNTNFGLGQLDFWAKWE